MTSGRHAHLLVKSLLDGTTDFVAFTGSWWLVAERSLPLESSTGTPQLLMLPVKASCAGNWLESQVICQAVKPYIVVRYPNCHSISPPDS
jgi:hypothetical protein